MFETSLIVDAQRSGIRIDSFLLSHFRNYSRFRIQRMIEAGCACVDGERVLLLRRVFRGETVDLTLCEPPDKLHVAEDIPLDIVFEDPWLVVVNKPPGMVAHPVGKFQSGTLMNALQCHFDRQTARRGLLRPGIVHRIDRMTSGLIVVARDYVAHRNLSIAFQQNQVRKSYFAIVQGCVEPNAGVIDQPIGRVAAAKSVLMSCQPDALKPRAAVTRFEVMTRGSDCSLLLVKPETGRNHQIRVHLAGMGHPLVDEPFYAADGGLLPVLPDASDWISLRHALHANSLQFAHPVTDVPLSFEIPLADDLRQMIDAE